MNVTERCACGAITFNVAGSLRPVIACHCTQCRKASGYYVTATSALLDGVLVTGEVTRFQSSQSARRGFCRACGSNLFWDGRPGDHLTIDAGPLDEDRRLCLSGHIFCANKGTYYGLNDNMPKADGHDPDLITMVEK